MKRNPKRLLCKGGPERQMVQTFGLSFTDPLLTESVIPGMVCPPLWLSWEALPSQALRFIMEPRLSLGPEGSRAQVWSLRARLFRVYDHPKEPPFCKMVATTFRGKFCVHRKNSNLKPQKSSGCYHLNGEKRAPWLFRVYSGMTNYLVVRRLL